MLQLAKTRHAKERNDRFPLLSRRHSSFLFINIEAPQKPWTSCCYGLAVTSNMVAVPRSRHASWTQQAFFFCLTVLAAVVDAERTADVFSQFGHIVGDGNHRSIRTCFSGLFGLYLGIRGSGSNRFHIDHPNSSGVDFLSSLRLGDITCEPGKFLRKLLPRIYDQPLPISVSDRSHPAFVEALSYFLAEKVT